MLAGKKDLYLLERKELLIDLLRYTARDPSTKEIDKIPKWRGDFDDKDPIAYLRDLTTHLGCMKLDIRSKLNLLQKAMTEPAFGCYQSKRVNIKIYQDFCFAFLHEYASEEKVKVRLKRLRKTNID